MRNFDEIVARIDALMPHDMFGFDTNDLIAVLDYDNAKQYLNPEVTEKEWTAVPRDRESVITQMLEYMPFAWDKANGCRGISASRSMSHYMAWIWLAGDDLGNLMDYEFYGKPELRRICEHYGWDADQWDDGERTNEG